MAPRTNSSCSDDDSMDGFCCTCVDGIERLAIDVTVTDTPQLIAPPPPPPPPPMPPPTPTQPGHYQEFFDQWSGDVQSYVKSTLIPQMVDAVISPVSLVTFVKSCTAVQAALEVQTDAERVLQELQNTKDASPEIIQQAQESVKAAQRNVQISTETCQDFAATTILQPLEKTFLSTTSDDFDDTIFILYLTLLPSNVSKIVAWCNSSEANGNQLLSTLLEPRALLLRKMMESGGPSNGQYGRAVQLYNQMQCMQHDPHPLLGDSKVASMLQRLQLAVALEHAEPIAYFGTPSQHVDPIQRYQHYKNAFLLSELDVHFIQFNVWELRQIVNSDATDAELLWGRQSLMAYRPDLVLSNDPLWNYCTVVRTDVGYTTPDWYKSPRSYDQILSGGGKCGPRAWYGRFICKAFGIPTWGVRQPGHAAMTRWTTYGWDVCLGGGMWKSWWNDQGGLDFVLETKARAACASELIFLQKVYRLQWLAQYYYFEKTEMVRRNGQYDPNNPWYTLSMIQRQLLPVVNNKTSKQILMFPAQHRGNNQLERISTYCSAAATANNAPGVIIIPATSCLPNNKIMSMPSFLGGEQLLVKDDAEIVYEIDVNLLGTRHELPVNDAALSYSLSCRIATAHRSEQNISLTINDTSVYNISMPYTIALWGDTEPINIDIDVTNRQTVTMRFQRPKQNYGFAFREFQMIPL